MNKRLKGFFTGAVMSLVMACSAGRPGSAEEVRLRTAEQSKGCANVGATHVSVVDRLGQQGWSPERVAVELRKLAKNGAVQLGGNTIVEMTEVMDGTQSFAVFNCSE